MAKIPKNLSDKSMLGDYKEQITFENDIFAEELMAPRPIKVEKKEKVAYGSDFFTPQLQEKVGKALLELKVALFNEGIVDFEIKVVRQDKQIVLSALPKQQKIK